MRVTTAATATVATATVFLMVLFVDVQRWGPSSTPSVLSAVAVCVAVALSGWWPRAGTLAGLALLSGHVAFTTGDGTFPALVVLTALVAVVAAGRFVLAAVASCWWYLLVAHPRTAVEREPSHAVPNLLAWLLLLTTAWVLGSAFHHQRTQRARLQSRHETTLQAQRVLIARSLHDTIAQTNAAIVLTAEAVLPRVAADEEAARDVRGIASCARGNAEVLQELMTTLRLDPSAVPDPLDEEDLPVGTYLGRRRETLRAGGLALGVLCEPPVDSLDGATRRTLLRVCREATNNMLKHAAPGPCTVSVCSTSDGVEVVATNSVDGGSTASPRGHGGLGLVGLREVVEDLGGGLAAGPAREGSTTWVLEVHVPVRGARG